MYLLQPVTAEFRSGLNKLLLPIKKTKLGKVVRNIVAGVKRKFKVKYYLRRTKSGKTITVNVDKTNVPNTVTKVATNLETKPKFLTLSIPADKYKGEYLMKGKSYKADELFDINSYRYVGDKPLLTGKNAKSKYKTTKTNKSEYDTRLLNIDISKAPKELVAKLGKGASSIDKLDAYRELERLGLLNKKNVKATRRYKLGADEDIISQGFYKSSSKLSKFSKMS
jgi:hypothetical protein